MIDLIFTACLIAAPAACEERQLTFAARDLTPMTCLMSGQPHLAEWADAHPGWRIARYKCVSTKNVAFGI